MKTNTNILTCLFFILNIGFGNAQTAVLSIEVLTDFAPRETTWTLYDADENSLIDDDGAISEAFELYIATYTIDLSSCYRFEIRDAGWNGIAEWGGNYTLKLDGRIIVANGGNFKNQAEHFINCPDVGLACANAIPIHVPLMLHPIQENIWYKITPLRYGIYEFSTCSNRVSGSPVDLDLWIYEYCPSELSDGPEGAIVFNANSEICEPAAEINYIILHPDKTYYVRIKVNIPNFTSPVVLHTTLSDDIPGCMNPNSCNYNPFATVDDGDCDFLDCLPDLKLNEEELRQSVRLDAEINNDPCFVEEGCMNGMGIRQLVRFTTYIENIGNTDYIIGTPQDNPDAFSTDNCHGHPHHLGYAEYLLYSDAGAPVPIGFKNGFCVLDLDCRSGGGTYKYTCDYMGISKGCADIYDSDLECQWIDVTDIPDGLYTLVVRINWTKQPDIRGKEEANYENNWGQVCIELDRSNNGRLEMSVINNCPIYVDCFGEVRGSAEIDCNGICGGNGSFGDINNDFSLNNSDTKTYMQQIVATETKAERCYDLNGDNRLSIYDAALLQECMESSELEILAAYQHCLFPSGYTNIYQNVSLQLNAINLEEGYVDIHYLSPDAAIVAFDLELSAAKISNVIPLGQENMKLQWGGNRIVGITATSSALPQNFEQRLFLRIYFQHLPETEICIDAIHDIVNSAYEKTLTTIQESCQATSIISSTIEHQTSSKLKIHPNPSNGLLWVEAKTGVKLQSISLINVQGKQIQHWSPIQRTGYQLELRSMEKGLYFLKIETMNSEMQLQKIILQE